MNLKYYKTRKFITNMSNEKEDGVHIYLKSDPQTDAKVLEGASAHERYIILMNDSLQKRADKDLCKIKELELRVSELEDENDSSDTRRNYIKGLLKNFHEMHKLNEKLVCLENGMKKETQRFVKSYKAGLMWHLRILHSIFAGVLALSWEFFDVWTVAILGCTLSIVTAFHYSMMQNLSIPRLAEREDNATKLRKEKSKILVAQDYIHEFIDSM